MKGRSIIMKAVRASVPGCRAFTLVELLVAMSVLILLMILITQLFNGASSATGRGNKHMDADAQARAVFDRMAIDFSQMVKRADVDYYLKSPSNTQTGNDRMAFYSQVPGYYPATGAQSPVSLIAYRINTDNSSASLNKLERLGTGLVWNGVSATDTPVVFLPLTLSATWPSATNMAADPNYELAGPQVFRMEYHYILRGQTIAGTSYPSKPSITPWNTDIPGHTSMNGLQDVAAFSICLAIIDPKSRLLVTDSQLTDLAAQMNDSSATDTTGQLEAQWQSAVTASALPPPAAAAIRIYRRTFYLPSNTATDD